MKILLMMLMALSANTMASQIVCTKQGYIMGVNGNTYAEQIKEKNKRNLLRFDFASLHVTRHFNGKEFSRKLTEIEKHSYQEDYLFGIVIHHFNDEKTQLASIAEANREKVLTYLYTCSDYSELDKGIET